MHLILDIDLITLTAVNLPHVPVYWIPRSGGWSAMVDQAGQIAMILAGVSGVGYAIAAIVRASCQGAAEIILAKRGEIRPPDRRPTLPSLRSIRRDRCDSEGRRQDGSSPPQ
jgi:hypothetical protein